METERFNVLSTKFGLDSQIVVDLYKSFADHINIPIFFGISIMNLLKMFVKRMCLLVMIYLCTRLNLFYLLFTLKNHPFL